MNRDREPVYTAARAVDVGYFSTKFSYGRKQKHAGGDLAIAVDMFPSLAPRLQSAADVDSPAARKTDGCTVELGGVRYFVGREVAYCSTASEVRPVLDDYATTPRYLALVRGALFYMLVDAGSPAEMVIGNLVLGLPLTTFAAHRAQLARRMVGEHMIVGAGGTRRVTVQHAHVIPQPHGSLMNFNSPGNNRGVDGWTLVFDVGGGTTDWYVGKKGAVNFERSGSYPKAMLACAAAVAMGLGREDWLDQFEVMSWIDECIRKGRDSFQVQGEVYPLAPHRHAIEAVMEESIEKMLAKVGPLDNIECILLTGGGAALFGEFLSRKKPKLARLMKIDDDPVYSNVRGFQVYGELQQGKPGSADGHAQ